MQHKCSVQQGLQQIRIRNFTHPNRNNQITLSLLSQKSQRGRNAKAVWLRETHTFCIFNILIYARQPQRLKQAENHITHTQQEEGSEQSGVQAGKLGKSKHLINIDEGQVAVAG